MKSQKTKVQILPGDIVVSNDVFSYASTTPIYSHHDMSRMPKLGLHPGQLAFVLGGATAINGTDWLLVLVPEGIGYVHVNWVSRKKMSPKKNTYIV